MTYQPFGEHIVTTLLVSWLVDSTNHSMIIPKARPMTAMRTCLVCTLSPFLTLPLIAVSASAADKPVKVYILSGQSNMVGIGQANPSGMTRYNTYVSADRDAKKGATSRSIAARTTPRWIMTSRSRSRRITYARLLAAHIVPDR